MSPRQVATVVLCGAATGLLSGCGSIQLPRALSPAERAEVRAASIPAVVGVLPSSVRGEAETVREILNGTALFNRVALAEDLDRPPDLLVEVEEPCDRKATTLVPMFTWLTLGFLPTWIHDGYGDSLAIYPPGSPERRVVIGCGPDRTVVFGWLGAPLNVLPGWAFTDPVKHPRYVHRLALELARREEDLRALLEPP